MAAWHLDSLREALERRGWICAELPGDDRRVSATWQLTRRGDDRVLHLDFEGLDEKHVLPLSRSYGCSVRETGEKLYFRRRRSHERWQNELRAFVEDLEA